MEKLIVILGPTASGKTDLSLLLAKKFNGEIISADSRQVYKGLDVGSGKVTKQEMQGIPHHLLDVASPSRKFSVAQYQKLALQKIKGVREKRKLPFLVGGTGLYIQSIVDGIVLPAVKPDWELRKKLEHRNPAELFFMLKNLDPARAMAVDAKNPRRLIRAIEIAREKPVPPLKKNPQFAVLQIGIKKSPAELKALIAKRLEKRIPGIITEAEKLHRGGLSWKRLEELGLEYRFAAHCLQKKISREEMTGRLRKEIEHFAKRQMTWFKRDPRIRWIAHSRDAEHLIKDFLK